MAIPQYAQAGYGEYLKSSHHLYKMLLQHHIIQVALVAEFLLVVTGRAHHQAKMELTKAQVD